MTQEPTKDKVFPSLGDTPVAEISPQKLLRVLQWLEKDGLLETAHRTRTVVGQVMRYAVATGQADRDPTPDLRGALSPVKQKHHAVSDY